jgi:hypothetical protein
MVLTRAEVGYVLIAGLALAAVIAAWRRRRPDVLNLVCLATAMIVCLPWLGYTYSLAHKFPYWESSGGASLYWMAVPAGTGSYQNTRDALTDPRLRAERPLFARIAPLPQVDRETQLQDAATKLIERHPGTFALHTLENVGRMVIDVPYTFETTGLVAYLVYAVPDLVLLGALLVAFWLLKRWPRPTVPPLVVFVATFGLLNFLLHLPVGAYPRMMTLSIPAVLTVIAVAAHEIVVRSSRRTGVEERRASRSVSQRIASAA